MATPTPAQLQTSVVSASRLAVLLFVVLIFPTNAAAQGDIPRDDVGLDIDFPGMRYPAIRMSLSRGRISTVVRREQLMIIDANSAGDFTGVEVSAEHGGDAI